MNQQKQNNQNNRKFLYLLAGMLLLLGAIGVVSAKQTASIYDAPDLHLVQGSEKYDLMEGITYDSGKYELEVKDTGDFDINTIGKYEVSYTLTLKGEATSSKEESGEKAQSTEKESAEQSTEKSSVQSAEEDDAAQSAEDSKAVSENKDKAVTQADDKTTVEESADKSADETSDTNTKETKSDTKETESDSDEETILFKRTVFVEGKDGQKDYIYAPELEVQAGSTDYDLLADVEVRNLEDDSVVEEAEVTVEDMSELEENAMTEEEQAEAKAGQDAEENEGSMPPLKEGEYKVTLSAVGEDDEAITVERNIVVLSEEDTGTVYFESLAGDKGWINSITSGVIKQGTSGLTFWYHEFNEKRIEGPYEGGSQKFQGLYGKVPAWYYITETDIADTLAGRAGYYRKMQRYEAKQYPGYAAWAGVDKNLEERKGDWSNFLPDGVRTGKILKDGGEPDVKFTLKKDATQKLTFGNFNQYVQNYQDSSLVIDGEENTHTFDLRYSAVGLASDYAGLPIPVDQVEIRNVNFELSDTTKHSILSNTKWLRLKGLTVKEKNRDWGKIIDVTSKSIELILDNPKNPRYTINNTGNYNVYDELLVKAGSEDAENPISISQINNYNKTFHTVIDTSEGGNLTFSIFNVKRSLDGNSEVVLQGNGKIIFDNRLSSDWNSGEDNEQASQKSTYNLDVIPALQGSVVTLKNNITIAKTHLIREYNTKGLNDRKTTFALSLDQKLNSNGYKITFEGNGYNLDTDNETVVGNTETLDGGYGVSPRTNLDPTDYALSLTEKDGKYYYLTLAEDAKRVVVTSSDHLPIQVSPAVDGTEYFADYKTALEAIRDNGDANTDYIITNDQDVDFGYGDTNNETATALASITDAHAHSLTFKSATRKADTDGNVAQGNYGEHYLVRMRTRKIVLPASVPVTFEDMVMKYDQGTQADVKATAEDGTVTYYDDLVFDANGSNLTFAGTTTFWKDNGVDEKQMYPTVYGAGSGFAKDLNVTAGNAANARITVAEGGSVVLGNIYNYSTLTNNGSLEVTGELLSQKEGNTYKGETILGGADSELILSNAEGKKSMGSLKVAEDATAKPKLKLARVAETEGKDASNQNNPYILNLTDENPLKVLKDNVQLIEVSYCSGEGTHNDVIFNLPNVADRKNVTVEPLYSGFSLGLFPEKDKKYICLKETKILVIDDNTQDKHRETGLGEAILEISKLNSKTPDHTYTISFTKNDYKVVDFDREVLEYVLGTKSGTYTYQDIDYPDLAKVAEIGKFTWCGTFTETGANADTYGTVTSTEDLVFFGKEIVIRDINWSISNGKGMYANGEPLVFDGNVTFADGTVTPISGSDPAGNKAAAEIQVQKSMTAGSFVNFKDLTVGEGGTTQTVLTLTGKIQATPATKSKKAKNTNAVQKLLQFFSGNDEDADDKADAQAQSSTGTVSLKNAHLKLTGLESSSFTSLVADNNNNQLTIPKDDTNKKTYPIHLSERTELADAAKKIQVNTATTATEGDKIVVYADKANADAAQYQNASFKVVQEENILFLKNDAKPIMKIELYEKEKTDKDFVKKGAYETYTDAFRAVGEGDRNKDYKFVNLVQTEFKSEDAQTLLEERKANSFTFEGGAYNAAYGGENRDGYYMVIMKMNNITLPSNYEVIWNQTVYHDGASESNRFEFYNNGGTLTFGERFSSTNRGYQQYDMVVYGGAKDSTCSIDSVINIEAGQFEAVYGGNKEGSYTGDVEININCPTDRIQSDGNKFRMKRLDGATRATSETLSKEVKKLLDESHADEWEQNTVSKDAEGINAKITIRNDKGGTATNELVIKSIYNYDELDVLSGTLTVPNDLGNDANVIASLIQGYNGRTVIYDGATLKLNNTFGFKRLGSLVRDDNAKIENQANFYYTRWADIASRDNGVYYLTSAKHPRGIWLTNEDPFELEKTKGAAANKCRLTINGSSPNPNEVVFYLSGVKGEAESDTVKNQVSVKGIESGFSNKSMYPQYSDKTIRIEEAYVLLKDPNGNVSKYRDISGAIAALSEKNATGKIAGKAYTIGFFRDEEYYFNKMITVDGNRVRQAHEDELKTMAYAAGKNSAEAANFTYLGQEYPDLAKNVEGTDITWTIKVDENGNSASGRYRTFYVADDINFFGANTTVDGILLNYAGNKANLDMDVVSRDIYANGSNLTFNRDTDTNNSTDRTLEPSIYGGSSKDPKTNTKKGGTITILSYTNRMYLYNVKDFKQLILGDNGKSGYRVTVRIYGQLSQKLDPNSQTKAETVSFFTAVVDKFRSLVGIQSADNPDTDPMPDEYVYLNDAYLELNGYNNEYQESYIENLVVSDHNGNHLNIGECTVSTKRRTYPLHISGKTILENKTAEATNGSDRKLYVSVIANDVVQGDALIEFGNKDNARPGQYRHGYGAGWTIKDQENFIVFARTTNNPTEFIEIYKNTDGSGTPVKTVRTYEQAFEYVKAEDDANTDYTFKNIYNAEFTDKDEAAFEQPMKAKSFTFMSGEYDATKGYTEVDVLTNASNKNVYVVRFRTGQISMPSDIPVTWDIALKYEGDANNRLEFIGNGGEVTFTENFRNSSMAHRPYGMVVYGGAASNEVNEDGTEIPCRKDVTLNIYGGQFYEIYGGNKEGQHTGNVEINIGRNSDKLTEADRLYIRRLDGAGANTRSSDTENNRKIADDMITAIGAQNVDSYKYPEIARDNKDATAKITIRNDAVMNMDSSVTGKPIQIENIFNYDELNVENGVLTIAYLTNYPNLVASLLTGYSGKTIIGDGAALRFENAWSIKRMGSLVRQDNADATKRASLYFTRTGNYNGRIGPQRADSPFQMQLTDEDPFKAATPSGAKIFIRTDSENDNDVVFKLSGVKDNDEAKKKYITLNTLESGFNEYNMYPSYEDATIRLEMAYVMLTDPSGNRTKYRDVAGAIAALADKEVARKNSKKEYSITFFRNEPYVMNWTNTVNNEKVLRGHADELKAMEYAAGKGEGTFTYWNQEYPNLSTDVSQAQITWNGSNDYLGNYQREGIEFYASGDLNFFGTDTTVDGLYLNFSNNHGNRPADVTSRDIYGNGSNILFKAGSYVRGVPNDQSPDANLWPSLYGGDSKDSATQKVKGKKITILGNGQRFRFKDLKDFTLLTIGDEGKSNRPDVVIYGQVNHKLDTGTSVTAKIASFFHSAVQALANVVSPQADETQVDFDKELEKADGAVYLNYGILRLQGYQKSYITNMFVSDSNENILVIPKDTSNSRNRTYPIQISGKTFLKNTTITDRSLLTYVTAGEKHGDVIVQYQNTSNADEKQYRSPYGGLTIDKNKKSLIYKEAVKPVDIIEIYKDYKGDGKDQPLDTVRTYEEAFDYVTTAADPTADYTFRNIHDADFTEADANALEKLDSTVAKNFTFINGDYDATKAGTDIEGKYAIFFRTPEVTMPSDIPVTWNAIFYYVETAKRLEFIGNGGEVTFGEKFKHWNYGESAYDVVVYGGAASGECNKNVTINIFAGQFYEIYGGNKEGKHTGDVKINLSAPTEKAKDRSYLRIYRLDGASADSGTNDTTSNRQVLNDMIAAYATGKTEVNGQWTFPEIERDNSNATVEITITNEVDTAKYNTMDDLTKRNYSIQVNNLFNYDTFTVEQGMFYQPDESDGDYNVNTISSLVKGYKGKTVIADGAEIFFLQNWGHRRLGSLVGKASKVSTTTARLYYVLQGTFAGKGYDSKENPWAICLSDKDPFGLESFNGHRVSVASYGGEHQNDVVFNLTGLEAGTESHYTSTKTLESTFENFRLYPDADDTTIRLDNSTVMLIDGNGNRSRYENIAAAIVAISERETKDANGNYPKGEYTIAFYKGGDYTTSESDLLAMKLAAGKGEPDEKFTYQGVEYDLSNVSQAAKITWNGHMNSAGARARDWSYFHPTGDLNFFGTNTEIAGLQLNYDNYTNKKSTSKDIYANGSNLTFADYSYVPGSEYPNLYGGSKDKTKKGGEITILSRGDWMKLNDVRDFKTLKIGENINGRPILKIYGVLDSNPESVDTARIGKLVLKDAELCFEATASSGHVGSIETQDKENKQNATNFIRIYRDANGTKPFYVDGTVDQKAAQPITVNTQGTQKQREDIIFIFKEKENAKAAHYKSEDTGYTIFKRGKNILYANAGHLLLNSDMVKDALISKLGKDNNDKNTLYYYSTLLKDGTEGTAIWSNLTARTHTGITYKQEDTDTDATVTLLDSSANVSQFNIRGQIENAGKGASLTIDANDNYLVGATNASHGNWFVDYFDDGMQLEIKNLKEIQYDWGHWSGPCVPRGGVLRLKNIYTESSGNENPVQLAYPSNPTGTERVEVYFSDTHPYSSQWGFDVAQDLYIKYGKIDIKSWQRISENTGKVYLDTNGRNTYWHWFGDRQEDTKIQLTIAGGGSIILSNERKSIWDYSHQYQMLQMALRQLILESDITIAKSTQSRGDSGAIEIYNKNLKTGNFVSNGHRIYAKVSGNSVRESNETLEVKDGGNFTDGEIFAGQSYDTNKLDSKCITWDATDFVIMAPAEDDDTVAEADKLYFTTERNGKIVKAVKLGTYPIQLLDNNNQEVGRYPTYADAIQAIPADAKGNYTIKNLIERNFEETDVEALAEFSNTDVSLTFESGERTDGMDNGLYRIRVRKQEFQMPANVDVTFKNILLKYEQGDNQYIEFIKNGGTLTFAENVTFLKGDGSDETPDGKPTVYGGSTTSDLTADSTIIVTADCTAHFAAIYGGGTRNLTGNTNIQLYGGMVDNVYGGGKGGSVTGTTFVNISLPNTVDAATFSMDTISGSGTNEEGTTLEDNVTGDKTVTIAMKNNNLQGTLNLKTLAGFTTLNLGDENASYNHSMFKVSDRFDSNAQENNVERTGTVNLNRSSLTINSSKQGHIGSMVVSGESELNVYKAESTSPLKVDKIVTVDKGIRLRINAMKDGAEDNALGDKILEFKNPGNANRNSYVDGSGKNLSVGTEKGYILFKDSTGHDVSSWVEYPGADAGVLIDKLDTNVSQATVSKILHFDYNEGNTDKVRDGYVIAVPKNITEAAEQVKYSKVDSGFCKDGTFSQAFAQMFTEGTNYWKITFTKDADGNGATGVTPAIKIDNQNFIYVAHIVCDAREQSDREKDITTFIVDTSAPKQDTEATKVEQIDQDGATESVTYTLAVTDPVVEQEDLPAKDEAGKTHMTYTPAGIDQVFWAFSGEKDKNYVNAEADAQAAQREAKVDQPDGTGLNGTGTATADGKIELTISKAKLDKAKKDGKNLWVYVKDGENNTMKMMLNLDENVINVRVPLNVNVVAVKKAEGGDCELLAPNCYVVNDGSKEVTAAVNGFTTKEAKNLKLVKDKAADQTYGANEIALQLMPSTDDQTKNTFDKTNVLTLGRTNMLNIGTMQPKDNEGRIIGYTFDAAYNVKEINVPDEWISNTMSYHFTVKN